MEIRVDLDTYSEMWGMEGATSQLHLQMDQNLPPKLMKPYCIVNTSVMARH